MKKAIIESNKIKNEKNTISLSAIVLLLKKIDISDIINRATEQYIVYRNIYYFVAKNGKEYKFIAEIIIDAVNECIDNVILYDMNMNVISNDINLCDEMMIWRK